MPFPTSLQQIAQLPVLNSGGGVAAISGALAASTTQAISAQSLPSSAQIQAEALNKVQQNGTASKYSALSPDVGIAAQNGTMVATDAATGRVLAPIGTIQTAGLPAGIPDVSRDRTEEFKVRIKSEPVLSTMDNVLDDITLMVMPQISEARSASYKSFSPLHHPGEILKYESTAARTWNISTKLIARTVEEATLNLKIVNTIRSWVMPFFGEGTNRSKAKKFLGAPPPILTFTAYGEQMIGPVKCILENYSWDWPNDCDYLPTQNGIPFPVIMSISLSLKESWSPAEYSGFNILEYRKGNLPTAFSKIKAGDIANTAQQQTTPQTGDASRTSTSEPQTAGQSDVNANVPDITSAQLSSLK